MQPQNAQQQWDQIKQQIFQRWTEITDNDFSQFRGGAEELIRLIEQKTGQAREQIESYLNGISPDQDFIRSMKHWAIEHAKTASQTAQTMAQAASKEARAGYIQTKRMVHNNPMESLLVGVGVGLVAGVVGGLLLRQK